MNACTTQPTEVAGLNEQQRDGITCVRCGRVPLTPTTIASVANADLVACADDHARVCTRTIFWLTPPCPSWCREWHDEDDSGDDRTHLSRWQGKLPLILEDAGKMGRNLGCQPEHVSLYLVQGVREIAPRIWCGKGETNQGWHMTSAEARELATILMNAADLADNETPQPTTAPRTGPIPTSTTAAA